MHHFLDNDVIVEPLIDKQRVRLTAQDGTQTKALIIDCVDAVSPEDADLTEVEADRTISRYGRDNTVIVFTT